MSSSVRTEADRLAALRGLRILDTPPEEQFDAVCRVAQRLFDVPTALVSLVDEDRQWLKACVGPMGSDRARENAFCNVAIQSEQTLVVCDASEDERFCRNSFVAGASHLRFYAGVPLALSPGLRIGTLCIIDTKPRTFTQEQCRALEDLALIVASQLRLHEALLQRDAEVMARLSSEEREADLARREAILQETNTRLLRAEQIAHVGHWQIDVGRQERIWSPEVRNIFGIGINDPVPGLGDLNNGYHPADRDRVRTILSRAITDQDDFEFEARIVRPGGALREVVVRGVCGVDGTRGTRGLFGVCIDVTEINETERRLRDSEGRFKLLVESVADYAIYTLDPDGNVSNWNIGAQRAKGYSPDEIVGRNFSCFYTPEDQAKGLPAAALRTATETGHFEAEGWRVRKNGDRFWCSVVITAMRGEDGALLGFAKITRDITDRRSAEMELKASEARYRLLAENITDTIVQADMDTTRRYVSPSSKELLGYEPEELVGKTPLDNVDPSEAADYQAYFDQIRSGKSERIISRRQYRRKDGTSVWIEGVHRLIRDERGEPTGYIASLRDITDRKAVEDELRDKTVLLDRTLENMDQGLLMIDADGVLRIYNQRVVELLNLPDALLRSKPTMSQIVEYQAERNEFVRTPAEVLDALRSGPLRQPHHVYERERPDGTMLEVRTVRLDDGSAVQTITDITARKMAELRAEYMARHDVLTSLPNRRVFEERLEQELQKVHAGCAVLCLDLDRFKAVNDTFGHHAGDVVLKAISARIGALLGPDDVAARIGGDEFAILLAAAEPHRDIGVLASALLQSICEPFEVGGTRMSIGLSIGIAVAPGDASNPEQLVKNADLAMYRAKSEGRNAYRIYDPVMDRANEDRLLLEIDLTKALSEQQFVLHYQPCIDVSTGHVAGFEALLRWQHPDRGLISPASFIPLAEETGLIVPIGTWALNEACRIAVSWPEHVRVAVNVSVVQFRRNGLEQAVVTALVQSGLSPHRLELEITESVLVQDSDVVLARLNHLRAMGVRIALDDFGTGYSSLSYLQKFPFDKIKIDRSFISQIDDPDTSAIVQAIVGLGRHRGSSITAEGVETQPQLDRVIEAGCTEVQGCFYGRPVAPEQLSSIIETFDVRSPKQGRSSRRQHQVEKPCRVTPSEKECPLRLRVNEASPCRGRRGRGGKADQT